MEETTRKSKVVLEKNGVRYSFDFEWATHDKQPYPKHAADYMWEEGNYSCDCNKDLFIGRYCENREIPNDELKCGDTIKLIELSHY